MELGKKLVEHMGNSVKLDDSHNYHDRVLDVTLAHPVHQSVELSNYYEVVAHDDGAAAGYALMQKLPSGIFRITNSLYGYNAHGLEHPMMTGLFVDVPYRNKGLGQLLLNTLVEVAHELDERPKIEASFVNNASSLYERAGFSITPVGVGEDLQPLSAFYGQS